MTPQEHQRVAELFERLATLEDNQRDPQAERAIHEGLRQAPNAIYALVQTVLIQDEALRNADARIRELEGGDAPANGGFLDNMRGALFGGRGESRGSVPSVRQGEPSPSWQDRVQGGQPAPQSSGGSFLGTAAASAAGVIGGALLLNSMRSMFGGGNQQSAMDSSSAGNSPWSGNSGSDLSRDAGVNDIGRNAQNDGGRAGLFDTAQNDEESGDDDFDFGGDTDFG